MGYLDLAKDVEARLAAGGSLVAREVRLGDPGFVQAVTTIAWTPLEALEHAGALLEVRVPWWPDTLWFVPAATDADCLRAGGIARHRIWTVHELITLLEGMPLSPNDLSTLMVARREFDGDVVAVVLRPSKSDSPGTSGSLESQRCP